MKKTLIALAALAATGAVMAQSSVTIYGVIDMSLTKSSVSGGGDKSNTLLNRSSSMTNRLGFRGTEDLGGGLKAGFMIETNLFSDAPTAATIGDRSAWVSLSGDNWGQVRLGRDYNQAFWIPVLFSPFGTNGVGANVVHQWRNTYAGVNTATNNYIYNNNAIGYVLPGNLGGVYGHFQYALDEQAAAGNNLGQSTNFRIGYKNGPIDVALGYDNTDGFATTDDVKSTNLGVSYDFGVVRAMFNYAQDKYTPAAGGSSDKLTGYELGVVMPVATGRVRASYGTSKFDAVGASADPKVTKLAVGYVHDLSKRTSLYTTFARITNKNGAASTTLGGTGGNANRSATGIDVGISHSF